MSPRPSDAFSYQRQRKQFVRERKTPAFRGSRTQQENPFNCHRTDLSNPPADAQYTGQGVSNPDSKPVVLNEKEFSKRAPTRARHANRFYGGTACRCRRRQARRDPGPFPVRCVACLSPAIPGILFASVGRPYHSDPPCKALNTSQVNQPVSPHSIPYSEFQKRLLAKPFKKLFEGV